MFFLQIYEQCFYLAILLNKSVGKVQRNFRINNRNELKDKELETNGSLYMDRKKIVKLILN